MRPGFRPLPMVLLALGLTQSVAAEVDAALAPADCVPATRVLALTRIRGPEGMVAVGGQLFFIVVSSTDWSLWRSDGTVSGTVRVKTLAPITAPEGPRALLEARGLVDRNPAGQT